MVNNMSTGPGFNLSTKMKEDVSTRLKVHNLKRAKDETKKLEEEGKKMEERLMELKLAMNREKEERERQGGGFWKSGQQGTLNNYAEEVLAKKSKSAPVKGKIKILRDMPIELPERNAHPGTMAYIAQKGNLTPRDKPKGPKCGQCEERSAAVSCMQCSEDYCAGCFAAFHLKGNLKKHRSVPLTATPRQCFASPRTNPSLTSSSNDFMSSGDGTVATYVPESARKKDRNSPEGASGTYENQLLQGSYNEAEQAASFQDALKAWRTGKPTEYLASSRVSSRPSTDRSQKHGGILASPVQISSVGVDSSTQSQQNIEVNFETGSMSYAERLLLKKHRRTDVEPLLTVRSDDGIQDTSRNTSSEPQKITSRNVPKSGRRSQQREKSNISMKMEDFNDEDFEDERVDFQSLYQAVKCSEPDKSLYMNPDTVSIIEVQDSMLVNTDDQSVPYKVKEVGEHEEWSTDIQIHSDAKLHIETKSPRSGLSRRKSGQKSGRSRAINGDKKDSLISDRTELNSISKSRNENTYDINSKILGAKLTDIENEVRRNSKLRKSNGYLTNSTDLQGDNKHQFDSIKQNQDLIKANPDSSKPLTELSEFQTNSSKSQSQSSQESSKLRPDSSKSHLESSRSRAKSGKSQPQTSTRAQSRQDAQSRSASKHGSRPSSRITNRIGSSRASSKAEIPGLLTKAPSEALKEIARMAPSSDTYCGFDSFFMVGVQPKERQDEDMPLTPTSQKKEEKIKVSYQLYNMAPRSWKPDDSIIDAVPVDDVDQEDAEDDRASSVMAYHAYSEQLVSDITERLISRFGELPLDEDAVSDHSSGSAYRSLGEEYRTFTPSHNSSVSDSPIISSRGTPIHMKRPQTRESMKTPPQTPRKQQTPSVDAFRLPVSSETPRQQDDKNTPRQSARSRAQTPRLCKSRIEIQTPRRSKTYHGEIARPASRAVVMEGTDLSIFDTVGDNGVQNKEDEETLDQLEWELASQSGRVTADGKISRMELADDISDEDVNNSLESFRSMSRLGQDQGYDINSKLRKDELEAEESGIDDQTDVRNLM